MGRFDRENIEGDDLATSLAAVTDELRSSLEREIREIVETAKGRAAQIEEEAARRQGELEPVSDWKAQETLENGSDRLSRLLDGIDLLESGFRGMLGTLRTEVEGLRAELVEAPRPPEPPQQEDEAQTKEAPDRQSSVLSEEGLDQSAEPSHPVPLKLVTGGDDSPEGRLELEEMIRAHIRNMFDSGRSRAEAERFLTRFKSGENYRAVLNEIYPQVGHSRRGRRGIVSRVRRRRNR
jgi:hypothetical protein